jgi:hypothetical protein
MSTRSSASSISGASSSSSTGMTSTAANEVCRRLAWSNGEIRTSRWVPASAEASP